MTRHYAGAKATVFAPGSIGNVGPGFDVLGLAVDGIGDRVSVELTDHGAAVAEITGRDADLVPKDPARNVAAVAASAWLRAAHIDARPVVSIHKGLALSGGMGGSAASSVGGAFAASVAVERAGGPPASPVSIIEAALAGESLVSGRHLDNIAPSVLGGLVLSRSVDPVDVVAIPVPADWGVVLVTPHVRIETKAARAILPEQWPRASWVQQMANTAALLYAFATADASLLGRALDDLYAEPVRAALIPNFREVKHAALTHGALGCSISGAGPTIFAITPHVDHACGAAMKAAMRNVPADVHVAPIARQGVREV